MIFNKNKNGYTFIELLVTISIIILIAGAFAFGAFRRREERALNVSSYRLLQDLRMVQDKSLAPFEDSPTALFIAGSDTYYIVHAGRETIGLEEGIEVTTDLAVTFEPPHPTVYTGKGEDKEELTSGYRDVVISIENKPRSETVRIHASGLIEVLR